MTQLPLFEGLTPAQIESLAPLFNLCEYPAGTLLFAQGDPAENLYLVVAGEVVVNFKPDDAPPLVVAHLKAGSVVGWSAALGSHTYTSGAQCATAARLLCARGAALRDLCEQDSLVGAVLLDRLATAIAQRLSKAHDQVVLLLRKGLTTNTLSEGGA
jgi:CRP-like cAMP-binding protein